MKLDGCAALVTGGGRRIGRALALALAEQGVSVAVHHRRSETEAATCSGWVSQGRWSEENGRGRAVSMRASTVHVSRSSRVTSSIRNASSR